MGASWTGYRDCMKDYNTDQNAEVFVKEFFYAVGEIPSGKQLKDLQS
jgi:hypothetical protein